MKREVIAQKDPKSPIAEVFRTLRTNIQFMNSKKGLQTLLVTSTMPEEGKSWVSANLATTFAQAGKKTLLIDADMRKGRIHKIFGTTNVPGLSNYLSGIDEEDNVKSNITKHIRQTEIENLYIMPAGNVPPNPSELLADDEMIRMIEEFKKYFDFIILDGTPCILVTDSIILSRIVDTTVIVAEHKKTRKDNLIKVKKAIENVGGKIAGVVINKVPVNISKYNSSYYYSSSRKDRNTRKSEYEELVKEDVTQYKVRSNYNISKNKQEEILKQLNDYLGKDKTE
ncbi:MAG: CpsD/CapB family tyrosine-protein kinase [Clostridia bacterium]|nr:CpsD/CapB family tyrosine-protein kinase [Clostridia bacterium]